MINFFQRLRDTFDKIPSKTKFLKDIGFKNSYIGFRYFLQGRKNEPSLKLMENLCNELEYDYIQIPIKRDQDTEFLDTVYTAFEEDLDIYLKKYDGESSRTYTKNKAGKSSVSMAVADFEKEQALLDPKRKLDVSELF